MSFRRARARDVDESGRIHHVSNVFSCFLVEVKGKESFATNRGHLRRDKYLFTENGVIRCEEKKECDVEFEA